MSDENDMEGEREHWWMVMRVFLHYNEFVEAEVDRRQRHLNRLSNAHMQRLPQITFDKLGLIHDAADVNQHVFNSMVHYHAANNFLDPPQYALEGVADTENDAFPLPRKDVGPLVHFSQHHRNQAVLHSLYREWSKEAAEERAKSFGVLIDELERRRPVDPQNPYTLKVAVPGCGLGRLPLDIALRGYCCEGNEFSAYMAVASNFVLNGLSSTESLEIFPWISALSNIVRVQDTLDSVHVPDLVAQDALQGIGQGPDGSMRFSMAAGDFCQIYASDEYRGSFDVVVTCFFIDTAPNVLAYLDTIDWILKPGGLWINLGPLLYHWANDDENNQDERYDQSIELSYEELRHCVAGMGYELLLEQQRPCTYTDFPKSIMHTQYQAMQFTAQKPAAV